MARDRSPAAVARAFLARNAAPETGNDDCLNQDWFMNGECIVALVRAIRRECARVALGQRFAGNSAVVRTANRGITMAADAILALNRAPKKEVRRGR